MAMLLRNTFWTVAAVLVFSGITGCPEVPVGDPCFPEVKQEASKVQCRNDEDCAGEKKAIYCAKAEGDKRGVCSVFNPNQVSVESRSLQCRTRTCLVYFNYKTFCSCRCARIEGADDSGPLCECPEDASCQELITTDQALPNLRGSYCVPDEYLEQ